MYTIHFHFSIRTLLNIHDSKKRKEKNASFLEFVSLRKVIMISHYYPSYIDADSLILLIVDASTLNLNSVHLKIHKSHPC